ncbi:MAG TPA: hypothetical protein VMW35_15555 [Myxococcota bacterium]|nr:hypothetical protein [Myxococcota bacterium]
MAELPIHPAPHPGIERLRGLVRHPFRLGVTVQLPQRVGADAAQRGVLARGAVDAAAKRLAELGVAPGDLPAWQARLEAELTGGRGHGTRVALVTDAAEVSLDLPSELPYRVSVGRTLALRSVLRALSFAPPFHVLAVSQNRVRLYASDGIEIAEIPLGAIPGSLEDALGSELSEKGELRLRGTRSGGGAPVYYAHGDAASERKRDRERFEQAIAHGVHERFRRDATPLVLAAETAHLRGLRALLELPGLIEEGVASSPDRLSGDELRQRAAACIAAACAARESELTASLERSRNLGKVLEIVDDVAAASVTGRVRRLLVDLDRTQPGSVDPESGRAVAAVGDDDVFESLVAAVLARGGDVDVLPTAALAAASGVAAELR